MQLPAGSPGSVYRAVWRWHFYAGLFVIPFLLLLATSGLVMLLRGPIETLLYGDMLFVTPRGEPLSAGAQLAAVQEAHPHATATLYVPPAAPDHAAHVSVEPAAHAVHGDGHGSHGGATLSVFVDPYSGQVLGTLDPSATPSGWANAVHSTLLLGDLGDFLIEIAASLSILLVVSGLYLFWPRGVAWRVALIPHPGGWDRAGLRRLHAGLGFWISVPLLLFLISGMAWTGVWGGKLVQAWSTLSAERFQIPLSQHTHASLNRGVLNEVPWALEQTRLPASGFGAGEVVMKGPPDLDAVVGFARNAGFDGFRVSLPRGSEGVWTISASAMAGDVRSAGAERFVHLDRATGRLLADIRYDDYSLAGKAMAVGIPLHQGDLGLWNVVLNAMLCVLVMGMAIAGLTLWWRRAPSGGRFAAPPIPADRRAWRGVVVIMLLLALAFPLAAVAIVTAIAADGLLRRFRTAKRAPA